MRVRTGVASPTKGYDDILITNSLDYFQVVKTAYTNAKLPIPTNIYGDPSNPTVPKYIFAPSGAITQTDQWGRPITVEPGAMSQNRPSCRNH